MMKFKKMVKRTVGVALACALTLTLSACGETGNTSKNTTPSASGSAADSKETAEITMVLDWTPNTNHTGLYVAQEKGYFEENGLKVSIVQPPENGATDMVASGNAQFGVEFQDTMAAALGTDSPLPITAVAAILQHNTSGLVSLKDKGIDSPGKLAGHTYATWDSPIEQAILKYVVEKDGGKFEDVKLISTYVEDIVAGLNTDIESVWIYYGWDGIKLEQEKIETNYLAFKDMDEIFDYYSPVIISNNDYLEKNPEQAKAFLAAVKKGYEFAAENPDEAAEILLKAAPELDETLVKNSQKYLSEQYIADAKAWGEIDTERWNKFYNWLNENKLVEKDIPENTGFSMEYLK